ncbi:putative elongator complex protein 4 [Dictyocoela muelleri]|nr:putative elongator complex protein 4 [Dictyocoela muelleri]
MCAFRRTISSSQQIINHENFGIKFFDNLIGSIKPGMCILIEENKDTTHHINFLRAFASQAIYNKEIIFIMTKDMTDIKLPSKIFDKKSSDENFNDMKIAWRYRSLKSYDTEENFDFTKNLQIKLYCDLNRSDTLDQKLQKISELSDNSKIVIFSLFSPIWKYSENLDKKKIQNFLYDLKILSRNKKLQVIATIPAYLYDFNFRLNFDIVFKNIESDIYDGIIEIVKLRKPMEIKSHNLNSLKYGYYVKKSGIHVEYINIPPE